MNGMLNAANRNFRSIGGNFSNFHNSASPVNRISEEIYSQQAVNMPLKNYSREEEERRLDRPARVYQASVLRLYRYQVTGPDKSTSESFD